MTLSHFLLLEFLAELLNVTHTTDTPDALQEVVQTFCDDLRPWPTPTEAPQESCTVFSLFVEFSVDHATEMTTVQLSPEGEAFFRVWVRRQAVQIETGRRWDSQHGQ